MKQKHLQNLGRVAQAQDSPVDDLRELLRELIEKPMFNHIIFALIITSIGLLIAETDAQAVTGSFEDPVHPESPVVMKVASWTFICIFVAETACRAFVQGRHYFDIGTNVLDFMVVLGDFTLACFEEAMTGGALTGFAFLRCFRLLRLLRMFKIIKRFPELNYLLNGMMSSFRSISWGLVMVFIILLVWSIVAVQLLHTTNYRVAGQRAAEGTSDCERCALAFSSVWMSFITLTQTLVAGDSWGTTAIPVIEEAPYTFFVFMMAYACVALAALNLILAAIVDSGQQAREEAADARNADAKRARLQEEDDRFNYLMNLCRQIDADDSGRLSKEEMIKGFKTNKDFAQAMKDMGFGEMDLNVLFPCLDQDSDGAVDYAEFLELMKSSKMDDTKRMMIFTKFAVMDIWKILQEKIVKKEKEIMRKEDDIYKRLEKILAVNELELDALAPKSGIKAPSNIPQQRGTSRNGCLEPKQRSTQRIGAMKAEEGTGSTLSSNQSRGSRTASPAGSLNDKTPARKLSENDPEKLDTLKRGEGILEPSRANANRKADGSSLESLTGTRAKVAGDDLVQLMKKMLQQTEAQNEALCNIESTMSAWRSPDQTHNAFPSLRNTSEALPEAPRPSSHGTRLSGGLVRVGSGDRP